MYTIAGLGRFIYNEIAYLNR